MNRSLKIVADENMPNLQAQFARWGEICARPGRDICAADLTGCDILLVRSVTRVDAALLSNSSVQFVGSATIGTDHIDLEYLAAANIAFAHAPGCNAASVEQYDLAAMAHLRPKWRQQRIGILGGGNVGGRIASTLMALGVDVVVCDPFLDPTVVPWPLVGLEALLQCDIVLLHAPLTVTGAHPTRHLIGASELALLKPNGLLINAGRGAVIDNRALLDYLNANSGCDVVLDVWEQEPLVEAALLDKVTLGTPHIAGYSLQGRSNGTAMVAAGLAQHLGESLVDSGQEGPLEALTGVSDLNAAIVATYSVVADDQRLRAALLGQAGLGERRALFDQLRRHYPHRNEFSRYQLSTNDSALRQAARQLSFHLND